MEFDDDPVIRGICEVVTGGDWEALGSWLADDAVFLGTKGGIDESLVARGPRAVVDYFAEAAAMWESWAFEVDDVKRNRDTAVVFWRETSRSRHSPIEMVNETATVFRIHDGKIVEGRGYMNRAEALEAAGLAG